MFQELPARSKYFRSADKKRFIDLRRRKGYTNEIGKLNRDDSDFAITIQLKVPGEKKMILHVTGYYQVLMLNDDGGAHYELQRVWSKRAKACN